MFWKSFRSFVKGTFFNFLRSFPLSVALSAQPQPGHCQPGVCTVTFSDVSVDMCACHSLYPCPLVFLRLQSQLCARNSPLNGFTVYHFNQFFLDFICL